LIDVSDNWWSALLTAAIAGLVGGFVYELLQARSTAANSTGQIETPHRSDSPFLDLGLFASMIIGAAAAVAFCYFNQPHETTTIANGTSTTIREYDALQLIPVSLIVGSAGSSFFAAMQDKIRAALNAQSLELLVSTHRDAVERMRDPEVPREATVAAAETVDALGSHAVAASRQAMLRRSRRPGPLVSEAT